jgi:N6-adenosine-specific RNA methylase IME4
MYALFRDRMGHQPASRRAGLEQASTVMLSTWPFVNDDDAIAAGCVPALTPFAYGLLMVDPPWSFKTYSPNGHGKSAQRHYQCMTLADIMALPVNHLAADDCCLFLWATWPMLDQCMSTLDAWGFSYKTGGVWIKRTSRGNLHFGTGYRARSACEPFLLGFRGNPRNSRSERNLIDGPVRGHSVKPESAYEWCERYLPGVRRAEVFSRTPRPGWDTWGNEAGKFAKGSDVGTAAFPRERE